jgi:cytochrome c oxidase subunit 2
MLSNLIINNSPATNYQFGFQIPASPVMEGIINFHHDLFFFLTAILFFVFYLFARCIILFNHETNAKPIVVVHAPILEIV